MAADLYCVILMIVLVLIENKASTQCNHGRVRLVDGCVPNEGRVEVCTCTSMSCNWGTVCDDFWGPPDAQVVCRQLGYMSGAQALLGAHFGQGYSHQLISLDNVQCVGTEMTLLECDSNALFRHNCNHDEDAGVRCTGNSLLSNSIMNVSINNITRLKFNIISTQGIDLYTVIITWKWKNNSMIQNQLNSFQIECFSDQHRVEMSVNSTTLSVELFGLLRSTSYNCCVSAIYESYTTRRVCTEIATIQPPTSQPSETPMMPSNGGPIGDTNPDTNINETLNTCQTKESSFSASSSTADTIGGVLGFIITILLILLAVSGVALVYLLRPKFFRNVIPKQNSTGVSVRRNVSYATTPSQYSGSTISAQVVRPTSAGQNETDTAAANVYSRIGPSYETIDSRRQQQRPAVDTAGKNQASESAIAMLSESSRYEFSDAHLALAETTTMSCTADGVADSEVGLDYEVPRDLLTVKIEENEGYSRLQH